jgi:hypothetical protein
MQQFYKFITWRFVSLNTFRVPPRPSSGAYNCINSLWLEHGGSSVVSRGLAGYEAYGQTTTNNPATATLQGKIRGC